VSDAASGIIDRTNPRLDDEKYMPRTRDMSQSRRTHCRACAGAAGSVSRRVRFSTFNIYNSVLSTPLIDDPNALRRTTTPHSVRRSSPHTDDTHCSRRWRRWRCPSARIEFTLKFGTCSCCR